jgi:Family of unknown function (DUF5681)
MPFNPDIGAGTRWRKGQPSPNPGGRPKSRLLSEARRSRLAEVKEGDPAGRTYAEIVAQNLVEIACSEGPGAVHAAREIADRIEGRSRQQIEVADLRLTFAAGLTRNCCSIWTTVAGWTKPSTLIGDRCGCRCVAH